MVGRMLRMCYHLDMPRPKGTRKNHTIYIDPDVYQRARGVVEHIPGATISDVIEDFLRQFADTMEPLTVELRRVTSLDELAVVMSKFLGDMVGQASLGFTREVHKIARKEDDSTDG
jgi:antitoxin component of RelBE/YafQ-DinJ toxin-antitoxin module